MSSSSSSAASPGTAAPDLRSGQLRNLLLATLASTAPEERGTSEAYAARGASLDRIAVRLRDDGALGRLIPNGLTD